MEYINHGCNVIGPDCLVVCAKEHRPFPSQGYTCCLAMEGVRVLATGFEKTEKAEIERLVTSMGGEIEAKAVTNINFVIAKDVLAAKYKFAVNNLRKPILKIDWVFQCWREHRLVSYEPFRIPPFVGLTICATNIPLDERKEIEDACIRNGGSYSADLTKKCTHLIANVPQGDKFKVARRWGTVKIVNRQWLGQCLASKACLDEDLFPLSAGKDKPISSQYFPPHQNILSLESKKSEVVMSSAPSAVSNTVSCDQQVQCVNDCTGHEVFLQDDEQSILLKKSMESEAVEENMYLANCRVYFSGFGIPDLRKYVNMIRDGGGTRFMEFNERVTHVVVGELINSNQKEIRRISGTSTIQIVRPLWLEECHVLKKEVLVTQKHFFPDWLLMKGSSSQENENMHQTMSRTEQLSSVQDLGLEFDKSACCLQQITKDKTDLSLGDLDCSNKGTLGHESHFYFNSNDEQHVSQQLYVTKSKDPGLSHSVEKLLNDGGSKAQLDVTDSRVTKEARFLTTGSSSGTIFKGYIFAICSSFPVERRAEIVEWVIKGGGSMENDMWESAKKRIDFLVVTHGFKLTAAMLVMHAKPVSSHWIRFCLEEKKLLDVGSHVLYRPLQCQVPFPGFQGSRICISQYEEKDRLLLRNLCFVLGAKFNEKLSKKITHLLCKVKDGQKYHAACNWGIEITTADWLFACVSKDKILPLIDFQPRELSAAEKNTGVLGMTQCPNQNAFLASGDVGSQWISEADPSQSQEAKRAPKVSAKRSNSSAVDASVAHLSERNKYFLSMQAVTSQDDEAPFLDPWDEQTARWSGRDETKLKRAVHDGTSPPIQSEGDSSNLRVPQRSPPRSTAADCGRSACLKECGNGETPGFDQQATNVVDIKKEHSSDVAEAIEGLLARTSELKCNERKGLGVDQEISPEHTRLKRTREEPRFKRPRLQMMCSEKTQKPNASKSSLQDPSAFDESQLDSQTVGYDEDHTGKKLIMERVRTRSMSTTVRKAGSWKNDGLGRLFKVAEANK